MLVTFTCDAHENITMFGDDALYLLKLMGHSGTVPSAILAADVPDALNKLTQAIEREKTKSLPMLKTSGEDEDDDSAVSIVHRALPLMALLQDAIKHKCNVMWK